MAGDWIPMRMDLLDDPAVIGMALTLNMEEYQIAGRLLKVWSWANRHLKNGHAFVPDKWIDDFTSTPGFAAAMLAAGWLQTRSGGALEFVNFDRWNSQGAKIRLGETLRKRAFREKKAPPPRPENVPKLSRTMSRKCPVPEKRREEKSKEKDPPNPPLGGTDDKPWSPDAVPIPNQSPEFASAWMEWVSMRAAKKVPVTNRIARLSFEKLRKAGLTLTEATECVFESAANGWQGLVTERIIARRQTNSKSSPQRFPTKAEQEMAEFQARMASVARGNAELEERNSDDSNSEETLFAIDAFGHGTG